MKSEVYVKAELEIINFEQSDIVTASSPDPSDTDWSGGQGGGW